MFRPRWRKVISDLWDNKARTLLVIASIAIGVFAVGMIAGAYILIPEGMNTSYASANPANTRLSTTGLDEDFVQSLRRISGVDQVEGERAFTVRVQLGPDQWASLELAAKKDYTRQEINILKPFAGQAYPERREVVLFAPALAELNTTIGESITIQLPDGTLRSLQVVGTTKDLTAGLEGILNKRKGFVSFDTLPWLLQPESYNQLLITISGDKNNLDDIQAVSERINEQIESSGGMVFNTTNNPQNQHPLGYIVQAVLGVLSLLGVLVVFLSSSLIANTLNSLLSQQLRQIGVMKLIGGRSLQIIGMYLTFILLLSLVALAIAIPSGAAVAYWMSAQLAELINIELARTSPVPIIPEAVLLQMVIAIGVPLLAGIFPVRSGARTTVQEAVSGAANLGDPSGRRSRFDRWIESIRWVKGPNLVAIRNTFRRKSRLALTLFTLALGGSIFISVFNVQIALNRKVEDITQYFTADVNIDFSQSYLVEEIQQIGMRVPGVVRVEGWAATAVDWVGSSGATIDTITILAPPGESDLITPILLEGRWVQPGDGKVLAINEAFYDLAPDLKAGDFITINILGKEETWQVVGIFQYAGLDRLFAYSTYETLSRTLNEPNRARTYRIVTEQHDLAYQERLASQVDSLYRDRGFQVSSTEAGQSFTATITELLGVLTIVLLILAIMTALVGSIGLAGTLSMNVLERTREIGVMRAIGAYDQVVIQLVVVEGLLIGVFSYILAVLLSFPITSVLSNIISQAMFNSPANFAFTTNGFIIWLVVVLALSAFASVIPARSAARMTIREVLAYE